MPLNKSNAGTEPSIAYSADQPITSAYLSSPYYHDFVQRRYKAFFMTHNHKADICFSLFVSYLSYLTYTIDKKGKAYIEAFHFYNLMEEGDSDRAILEVIINEIEFEMGKDVDESVDKLFNLNVHDAIEFAEQQAELKRKIVSLKDQHTSFYFGLLEDTINLDEQYKLGRKFMKLQMKIERIFKRLVTLNPSSLSVTEQYLCFMKKMLDYPPAYFREWQLKVKELTLKKYSSKANKTAKEDVDPQSDLWNEQAGVVFIKLNQNEAGKIVSHTPSFLQLFGYDKDATLVGDNIRKVIPKVISKYHDEILKSYMTRGRITYGNKSYLRNIYGVTREGFLTPVNLTIKVEPINFMPTVGGILTPINEKRATIMTSTDGTIVNYSVDFIKEFELEKDAHRLIGVNVNYLVPKLLRYYFGPEKRDVSRGLGGGGVEKFYLIMEKDIGSSKTSERTAEGMNQLLTKVRSMHTVKSSGQAIEDTTVYSFEGEDYQSIKVMFRQIYRRRAVEDFIVYKIHAKIVRPELWHGRVRFMSIAIDHSALVKNLSKKTLILQRLGRINRTAISLPGTEIVAQVSQSTIGYQTPRHLKLPQFDKVSALDHYSSAASNGIIKKSAQNSHSARKMLNQVISDDLLATKESNKTRAIHRLVGNESPFQMTGIISFGHVKNLEALKATHVNGNTPLEVQKKMQSRFACRS